MWQIWPQQILGTDTEKSMAAWGLGPKTKVQISPILHQKANGQSMLKFSSSTDLQLQCRYQKKSVNVATCQVQICICATCDGWRCGGGGVCGAEALRGCFRRRRERGRRRCGSSGPEGGQGRKVASLLAPQHPDRAVGSARARPLLHEQRQQPPQSRR